MKHDMKQCQYRQLANKDANNVNIHTGKGITFK